MINCYKIIKDIRENKLMLMKKQALKQAEFSNSLWEKCILLRAFTRPQSTDAEKLIMKDLGISPPKDGVSGDGIKNGLNYEIKASLHDAKSKINIRQIRPHHNVDYYIIVCLNVFGGNHGEAFILKVPSKTIYKLVLQYGGYTHGTIQRNGVITAETLSDDSLDFEYSLSADPNANNNTKSKQLWLELIKYKVPYLKDSF